MWLGRLQPVCQDQDHQDRQFCLGEASSVGVGLNEFLLKQFFRPPLPPSLLYHRAQFLEQPLSRNIASPFDSVSNSPLLLLLESRGSTFLALRGPRLNRIYDLVRKRKSVPRDSDVYYREGGREGTFVAHERCGSAGSDPRLSLSLSLSEPTANFIITV